MIRNLCCVELSEAKIKEDVLKRFDCGHYDLNEYLVNDALQYSGNGCGVTYVLVNQKEYETKSINSVIAYMTIQTMALNYVKDGVTYGLPVAEIKYFAISKSVQKEVAYLIDSNKYYSTVLFEKFLLELYVLSIRTIGFQAIFLRANENGEKLYRRKFFVDADDFIIPYSEDDPLGQCKPLVLFIQDNLYSVFGEEQNYG